MRVKLASVGVLMLLTQSSAAETPAAFKWTAVPADQNPVEVSGYPFIQENSGKSWSLERAENSASHALRFEVRAGDQWADDQSSGENKERSELDGYKHRWTAASPVWIAYSFLIEPGEAYASDWTAISQMHGSEVRPFFVLLKNDRISVVTERKGGSGAVQKQVGEAKLGRGAWHSIVYHLVQRSSEGGSLKIWLDGAEIANYGGPIGSDSNKAYWKFGIYRGYGPIATPLAIEYANMEITEKDLSSRIKAPLPVR